MSIYEANITSTKKQLEFYEDLLERLGNENQQFKNKNIYLKYHIKDLEQQVLFLKQQLEQNNKVLNTSIILKNKYKEAIDEIIKNIQMLIDDVNNKTIISLGEFTFKLEDIQNALNNSKDIIVKGRVK